MDARVKPEHDELRDARARRRAQLIALSYVSLLGSSRRLYREGRVS